MKRILSLLLLAFMMLSFAACKAPTDGSEAPSEESKVSDDSEYHPSPDSIAVSQTEQQQGYKIYEGYFYYEGGQKYMYVAAEECVYALPQMIGIIMPADFFEGFSTGDTVRVKAMERFYASGSELRCKQIALVEEGEISDIPEEILAKFVERDAPNHKANDAQDAV